jgi:predicted nucleotide-binding protein
MRNKILLIEDDPSEFESIKNWLESNDEFSVIPKDFEPMALAMETFEQGNIEDYAIKQIQDSLDEIGLVLCDIDLLGDTTGGNKVVKAIRNCTDLPKDFRTKLPIIAITHFANLQEQILADKANFTIGKELVEKQPSVQKITIKNQIDFFEQNYKKKQKVFIAHGHNKTITNEVELLLRKLDLDPVISTQHANKGDTIIEKLIRETKDVKYAIVLYTACDQGMAKKEPKFNPRARQNVVFEHGLVCGTLKRNRVAALVEEDVEIPDDLTGVVFIKLDEKQRWKLELAREMKEAGLPVDMNIIFQP